MRLNLYYHTSLFVLGVLVLRGADLSSSLLVRLTQRNRVQWGLLVSDADTRSVVTMIRDAKHVKALLAASFEGNLAIGLVGVMTRDATRRMGLPVAVHYGGVSALLLLYGMWIDRRYQRAKHPVCLYDIDHPGFSVLDSIDDDENRAYALAINTSFGLRWPIEHRYLNRDTWIEQARLYAALKTISPDSGFWIPLSGSGVVERDGQYRLYGNPVAYQELNMDSIPSVADTVTRISHDITQLLTRALEDGVQPHDYSFLCSKSGSVGAALCAPEESDRLREAFSIPHTVALPLRLPYLCNNRRDDIFCCEYGGAYYIMTGSFLSEIPRNVLEPMLLLVTHMRPLPSHIFSTFLSQHRSYLRSLHLPWPLPDGCSLDALRVHSCIQSHYLQLFSIGRLNNSVIPRISSDAQRAVIGTVIVPYDRLPTLSTTLQEDVDACREVLEKDDFQYNSVDSFVEPNTLGSALLSSAATVAHINTMCKLSPPLKPLHIGIRWDNSLVFNVATDQGTKYVVMAADGDFDTDAIDGIQSWKKHAAPRLDMRVDTFAEAMGSRCISNSMVDNATRITRVAIDTARFNGALTLAALHAGVTDHFSCYYLPNGTVPSVGTQAESKEQHGTIQVGNVMLRMRCYAIDYTKLLSRYPTVVAAIAAEDKRAKQWIAPYNSTNYYDYERVVSFLRKPIGEWPAGAATLLGVENYPQDTVLLPHRPVALIGFASSSALMERINSNPSHCRETAFMFSLFNGYGRPPGFDCCCYVCVSKITQLISPWLDNQQGLVDLVEDYLDTHALRRDYVQGLEDDVRRNFEWGG